MLVRDRPQGGIEILLVQRHASMGFMGSMHVFPGGKVCADDGSPKLAALIADGDPDARHAVWGEEIDAAASRARAIAAIRETFEEAGVLLGRGEALRDLAPLRSALLAGAPFAELLEQHALTLELGALQPLSRWITPASERTRFDTSFYVARAPHAQEARHDETENVACDWFAPADAIASSHRGAIRLAPPTALTIEAFAGARSADEALAIAARRPPPVILPILQRQGDDVVILYPGDPDHPVPVPAFPGPTRRVLRRV